MAYHKSAKKKFRRDEKQRVVNRKNRSLLRTDLKKFRSALADENIDVVKEMFKPTLSGIDKAVQKGSIHKNRADRLKSRLTRHHNKLMEKEAEVKAKKMEIKEETKKAPAKPAKKAAKKKKKTEE